MDADGTTTLTFGQAQTKAVDWFAQIDRNGGRVHQPITVVEAMDAYLRDYSARGGKGLRDLQTTVRAHILPALGHRLVDDLTFLTLKRWHQGLAAAPARLRSKRTAATPKVRPIVATDPEAARARRATANRVLTVLRAALSLA